MCIFYFDFVLDVLMEVYAPRVYLSEVKVNFYLFLFGYCFVIGSIDAFYFDNNVAIYKALLV